MNSILLTLFIAFFIIILCAALLGISMLFTGKSRLRGGMCGRVPTKKRDDSAGCGSDVTCGLCGRGKDEDK